MTSLVPIPEPYKTVTQAIITKLGENDITCYDHQPIDLYGVPSAYLFASDTEIDVMRTDQGEMFIGQIRFDLNYYVSLVGDVQAAHYQAYDGVRRIVESFKDASLGGQVRDARIDVIRIDPIMLGRDDRPMLLVQAGVLVKPAAYTID